MLGDHSETVRVEFDPQRISYAELLEIFWDVHDPGYNTSHRQYRNAIFYLNEQQQRLAEQSRNAIAAKLQRPVQTDIEAAGQYAPAEAYHQKYYLRQHSLLFNEFSKIYPDPRQLAASTAAARVNGYLGCNGSVEQLQQELNDLGLSPRARQQLVEHLSSRCKQFRGFTCPAPE